MDDYAIVNSSKLKLKGEKRKIKKSKNKDKRSKTDSGTDSNNEDALRHGGWVCLDSIETITGTIAFEMLPYCYIRAMDNGLLAVGDPHAPGEPPYEEEMFTAIKISETHRAFKSGYDKYLSIDSNNRVVGRSDAIGQREQFEPVFQDGKLAIVACNGCFISADDNGYIVSKSQKAGPDEIVKIRSNVDPEAVRREVEESKVPEEEKGTLEDCEEKYIKKFQTGKISKILTKGGKVLESAKEEGRLHEALLDRREKIKSDKFCK
ncbi:protein FRG1 [Tetranychus urticae]|uniref:Uncharacterized protein n=1 Tax=Tetranychus urticae TaxID=32264 RepID=T1KLL4_TETUR|nr:protein FRG1 [Tetranychus urticae]